AHLGDARRALRNRYAPRAPAKVRTTRRPRPCRERAHLARRNLEEAVGHHLEDGNEVSLHGVRLRGHDLDLHRGVLRLVGAVDPVAVQDHPEGLRAPRHGRRDAGGEAGWRHLQAALALRAADPHTLVTIHRTHVSPTLTPD